MAGQLYRTASAKTSFLSNETGRIAGHFDEFAKDEKMNLKTIIIAGTLVTAGIAGALAHGGATGIVKERMDAMGVMGKAVKAITEMMRGEKEYSADAVREGAKIIKSHAGDSMTKLFPEGSTQKPTEARPEIWSNWDEFKALADQLLTLADGLEQAADNGMMMSNSNDTSTMMGGGNNSSMMGGSSDSMMGGSGMMGNGTMMRGGRMMDTKALAQMPVDGVFNMVAQTCSACHTKFRIEKK